MARARMLKPTFFTNEDLLELPFETRLLFAGLWTLADREGRLEDRPKRIKIELFPADNVDIDAMLDALADKLFIERYEWEGQHLIQVLNFLKHQHPHHREPESTYPPPYGCACDLGIALGQPEASPSEYGIRNTDTGQIGSRNTETESEVAPAGAGRSSVKREWENRIGVIPPSALKEFGDYERLVGEDWFMQAIDETATKATSPSWSYCVRILKRCVETGQPPRAAPKGPKAKPGSAREQVLARIATARNG